MKAKKKLSFVEPVRFFFSIYGQLCSHVVLAANFDTFYSVLKEHLCPLAAFQNGHGSLIATRLPNGDMGLRKVDGEEATFDIIGFVVACSLQAPPSFPM